ncbi:MAG: hypothetical protein COB04_17355 [Gammaproteobacteria bacterium]|nr:MAG: hypothetical protein COB04_17355 [Gammaproteobacteria bacterium]
MGPSSFITTGLIKDPCLTKTNEQRPLSINYEPIGMIKSTREDELVGLDKITVIDAESLAFGTLIGVKSITVSIRRH